MSFFTLAAAAASTTHQVVLAACSVFEASGNEYASAGIKFTRSGQVQSGTNSLGLDPVYVAAPSAAPWVVQKSASIGDSYHVRFTLLSGELSEGTLDTDLSLSTDRVIEVHQTGLGIKQAQVQVTLKRNGIALATATCNIQALVVTMGGV